MFPAAGHQLHHVGSWMKEPRSGETSGVQDQPVSCLFHWAMLLLEVASKNTHQYHSTADGPFPWGYNPL